ARALGVCVRGRPPPGWGGARTAAPARTAASVAAVGLEAAPSRRSARLATRPEAQRVPDLARETFIEGYRIDMAPLAARLGVDRTSVFRWVGNRDALLSEVLWSLAVPTLVQADRATEHLSGAQRLADLLTTFTRDLIEADYFRAFLRREPARSLRLLTTADSPIQRRFVATV